MKNTTLSLATELLYEADKKGFFISPETVQDLAEEVEQKLAQVEKKIGAGEYDFIEELKSPRFLTQVKTAWDNIQWAETLVVIGIGGSDLGGRAIVEAFVTPHSPMRVLFAGDSTDPVALRRLLDQVDLNKTVFNVISKSGQTLETLSTYVFFKSRVKQVTANWARHFVFTTSLKTGILHEEAVRHSVMVLAIPENVGGRFSVLTAVGLLPALAVGVDIEAMVVGGRDFAKSKANRRLAQELATSQYQLFRQGIKVCVMMTYTTQLQEFARWFRQLWAESLGKNDSGVLPIKAWGPADQHSQVQFYNEGSPLQSLLFVQIQERDVNYKLTDIDVPEAQYLEGRDFNYLLNLEAEATATSLANHGRPSAVLKIERLTPAALGELFMLFELAVVYLAELLGVNAFDQPGVEESKQIVNRSLGKK